MIMTNVVNKLTHGMQEAIKQGRWIWESSFGYKMGRDDFGKPILVPVEEEAFLISVAFELAEKGIYKQSEILQKITTISPTKISKHF